MRPRMQRKERSHTREAGQTDAHVLALPVIKVRCLFVRVELERDGSPRHAARMKYPAAWASATADRQAPAQDTRRHTDAVINTRLSAMILPSAVSYALAWWKLKCAGPIGNDLLPASTSPRLGITCTTIGRLRSNVMSSAAPFRYSANPRSFHSERVSGFWKRM